MEHYKVTLSEHERVKLQGIAGKGTHAWCMAWKGRLTLNNVSSRLKEKSGVSVLSRCMLKNWGCCVKLGLVYAVNSRLARYSRGLSEPREILMRFSLYQRI